MHMKIHMKNGLIFILTLFSLSIAAQNYQYDEYLFPDLKIKGMGIGGNAFGSSRYVIDTNRINGIVQLNTGYFQIENSRNKQKYVQYNADISYLRQDPLLSVFNFPEQELNFNFTSRGHNRNFRGTDNKGQQRFIEFDHIVSLDYYFRRYSDNAPVIIADKDELEGWLALPVRIGKGRLEPLAGLPVAEFLADDLLEAGLLSSSFTQEQLFELAQKIVAVDNARVFDFRRRNIYRFKELGTWLENQGIPMNVETFTILNDNYNFAFSGIRNQGKQQSLGIIPIFSAETQFSGDFTTGYGVGLQYEWTTQNNISKNLHKAWRATGSYYFFELDPVDVGSIVHARIQHDITYVPISRTIMTLSPFVSAMMLDMEDPAFIAGINGYASYFINDRLRITGNLSASYFYNPLQEFTLTLPDVIFNDNFRFPAQGDFGRNVPVYQTFAEKLNLAGNVSFSYFLF